MKTQPLVLIASAMLAIAIAGTARAATPAPTQSVQEILRVQHALRDKLSSSHSELSGLNRDAVSQMEHAQDQIFRMLEGVTSLDQLNAGQKVELFNALEQIKATMLANDGDRKICHHERKIGSNMIQLRCETVSERAARTEDANRFMSHDRLNTAPSNGGG